MSVTIAVDPGNVESGVAVIDTFDCRPIYVAKMRNEDLRDAILHRTLPGLDARAGHGFIESVAIERFRSYGMSVGQTVFDACEWAGRFYQAFMDMDGGGIEPVRVYRNPIKLHHCHSNKATDTNIKAALVDRFACGVRNHGKGTKDEPGWFFGFAKDMWAAYALAVYVADAGPEVAAAAGAVAA